MVCSISLEHFGLGVDLMSNSFLIQSALDLYYVALLCFCFMKHTFILLACMIPS